MEINFLEPETVYLFYLPFVGTKVGFRRPNVQM
jgi:hypothetical protein